MPNDTGEPTNPDPRAGDDDKHQRDRYQFTTTVDGQSLFYDAEIETAWLQSTVSVSLDAHR